MFLQPTLKQIYIYSKKKKDRDSKPRFNAWTTLIPIKSLSMGILGNYKTLATMTQDLRQKVFAKILLPLGHSGPKSVLLLASLHIFFFLCSWQRTVIPSEYWSDGIHLFWQLLQLTALLSLLGSRVYQTNWVEFCFLHSHIVLMNLLLWD